MRGGRALVLVAAVLLAACGAEVAAPDSTGVTTTSPPETTTSSTPTTSTSTTVAPTTTLPPTVPAGVVDVSAFFPLAFRIESDVPPCTAPPCVQQQYREDGARVVYDPSTATFRITTTQGGQRVVTWRDQPDGMQWVALMGYGPGEVAYVLVPDSTVDPLAVMVAVALSGPKAGTTLARSEPGDGSGDSDLVRAAGGWVSVGCCGPEPILPVPGQPLALGYVDESGRAIEGGATSWSWDRSGDPHIVTATLADGGTDTWTTPASLIVGLRGMPVFARSGEGTMLVAWSDASSLDTTMLAVHRDGRIDLARSSDVYVESISFGRARARTDDAVYDWPLIVTLDRVDGLDLVTHLLDGDATDSSADALLQRLVDSADPSQCDGARVIVDGRSGTDPVLARLSLIEPCDDSVIGAVVDVEVRPTGNGRWQVTAATSRAVCSRGAASNDACM